MNFLRDNLYANRQRVELAGHVKYRRLQNEDNMTMKVKLKTGALFLLLSAGPNVIRRLWPDLPFYA